MLLDFAMITGSWMWQRLYRLNLRGLERCCNCNACQPAAVLLGFIRPWDVCGNDSIELSYRLHSNVMIEPSHSYAPNHRRASTGSLNGFGYAPEIDTEISPRHSRDIPMSPEPVSRGRHLSELLEAFKLLIAV